MPPLVLLLREPDAPDPYEEALRARGFRARSIPVLRFRLVNRDALREALRTPQRYGGLIATSPRAIEALAGALPDVDAGLWQAKTVYVVGPGSARAVEALGLRARGAEAGSAEQLGPLLIRENRPGSRDERQRLASANPGPETSASDARPQTRNPEPLLFLTGNRTRDVLPERLREDGIPFETLCVYETHLRTDLDALTRRRADWMVFFSPSGVEAVRSVSSLDMSATRTAVIGQTTAAALEAVGWGPHATADRPDPEALVEAILRA